MSKIPFPNPHDADSLNTYLDALAAGKQVTPASDVEATAREFHQLASRAVVSVPKQSIEHERGDMQTATLAAPISNRTRRQMATTEKKAGRSYGWLSTVIVAGLLVSMIGSAWLNREPGNPHDQLAFAPGTPETLEVLTPESAPWIADYQSHECMLPSRQSQVEINPNATPGPEPERFAITGPADTETSAAIVEQFRAMRGCRSLSFAWSYWTERRMNQIPRNLDEQSRTELAELEDHFAELYPQQFMAVASDLEIDVLARQEWQAQEELGLQPIPMPLGAKLNPEWGVELSDGRIAFPTTVLYSAHDPVIARHGLPLNNAPDPVVMVFAFEDGDWKYDDSLLLCLADCDSGVGSPVVADDQDWLIAAHPENCTVEPISSAELRARTSTMPKYADREYGVAGTPEPEDATTAVARVREMNDCSLHADQMAMLGNFTDLGLVTLDPEVSPAITRGEVALALRHQERGTRELATRAFNWPVTVILDGDTPAEYVPEGWTWEPVSRGDSENSPTTRRSEAAFRPESTVLLDDGRIAVAPVWLIELDDRGAVRYEGEIWQQAAFTSIVREEGGKWLVDEIIAVTPSSLWAWYWDEQYDPEPFAWTQPVSYHDCPSEKVVTIDQETNPAGTRYTLEEYEGLTSERDYEIVGMAAPEDAVAVVTVMREMQACGLRNESIQAWSARFEWENRTTDGRISLGLIDDERLEASLSVSDWLQSELGLAPTDMVVEQETGDLDLDGTESLQPHFLYDPAHAILFADGRIGIIGSIVYYDELPADSEDSAPPYYATHMSFFVFNNGEWLLDENLQVCIGECPEYKDVADLNGDIIASPTPATPWPVEECVYCRPPGS